MPRKMVSSVPPEIFIFIGINVFTAMSLLISIFEGPFPKALPYVFQIAALTGFGQMWANNAYLSGFIENRFWSSIFYLAITLICVAGLNLYIALRKKLVSSGGIMLGAFTIPTSSLSFFLVSTYVNGGAIPMPSLPIVPLESLYSVLVSCIIILGASVLVYFKPAKLAKILAANRKQRKTDPIYFTVPNLDDQEITNQSEVEIK